MAMLQKLLLTGWKTIIGMILVVFGEGIKVVLPDYSHIGDVLVTVGAIIGAGGLVHKYVRA